MPRDARLYMTFPNDFWQHPKFAIVSDAALRTFVEMNGYSRIYNLDGNIPIVTARKMWKARAIDELLSNHPERPTLTVDGDMYVIRDYAEHQETSESIAARQERNRSNGSRGGRPRNPVANPNETDSVSKTKPKTNPTESRDRDRDRSTTPPKGGVERTHPTRINSSFEITEEMRAWAATETPLVDIAKARAEFIDYWTAVPGQRGVKTDWPATWRNSMRKQQTFAEQDAARPHAGGRKTTTKAADNAARYYEIYGDTDERTRSIQAPHPGIR